MLFNEANSVEEYVRDLLVGRKTPAQILEEIQSLAADRCGRPYKQDKDQPI